MQTIFVPGGAGFVGSSIALWLKQTNSNVRVIALDNLSRRGSELNVQRLATGGVEFVFGDVRLRADLDAVGRFDCLIDCSAEPSVQAGYSGSPEYLVQTNVVGTLNCLEVARRSDASVLFLSTSRVYPSASIGDLNLRETGTRYEIAGGQQPYPGVSAAGLTEAFPLDGPRSLYGATKLAAEFLITEYADAFEMPVIINRCGVIAGPWQMGKVDQGFVMFWVARHVFGGPLTYIGYGGSGKQVRDVLHISDLCELVSVQVAAIGGCRGDIFNVGGGRPHSVSLVELTGLCRDTTGVAVHIGSVSEARRHDLPIYLSDCAKVRARFNWAPARGVQTTVGDLATWVRTHREIVEPVLAS